LKKSIPAFEIELINPVTRHVVTGFVFVGALTCCWVNDLTAYLQIFLTLCVLLVSLYWYRSAAYCHRGVQKITCQHDAYWILTDKAGHESLATLLDSSAIIGPLYFLNFATLDKHNCLLLSSDSMSKKSARILRATIKVYRQQLISARL